MLNPVAARADSGAITSTINNSISGGYALSGDGTTLVGMNSSNHAFRWTSAGGMIDLGALGGCCSDAYSTSSDGSVVVGWGRTSSGGHDAYRWTAASGMVDIGFVPGYTYASYAVSVSGDGSVVVGRSFSSGYSTVHAFYWTQTGGMVDLGTLGGTNSAAFGISSDASTVVGQADLIGGSATHAFRWTQAGGMADLGTLGGTNSYAYAVSGDGGVVVGQAQTAASAFHAFRWTTASGMADLGTFGGNTSQAYAASSDGSVVVGYAQTAASAQHAFRWTAATGTQDLNALLTSVGVNMTGITLTNAEGVSSNGRIIAASDSSNAYLVTYEDATTNPIGGVTTAAAQQAATQDLVARQAATMIDSRATANQLLGATRPMTSNSYSFAGALVGSAVGYAGGQYTIPWTGITFLGGIAYGAQDYPGIAQSDAPTIAAAVRNVFDDPFGDEGHALHPFAEIGGWVTPQETLTMSRTYANGAGYATGQGGSNATTWGEYGRGGMLWHMDHDDDLMGYGEVGQQSLSFGAYSENLSSSNPFPASVESGVTRYGVARLGGAYTRDLESVIYAPWSVTLSGAVARSFDVHSGMNINVSGVGTTTASGQAETWGEFGAQIDARITDRAMVSVGLIGTTGAAPLSTAVHGSIGLGYRF